MREISQEKGGHARYDFALLTAKTIYRCPVGGCGHSMMYINRGQPINPNGLTQKLKSHICQEHSTIGSDIQIHITSRNRKAREVFAPCLTKPRQNRKGRAWSIDADDGNEGPSKPMTEEQLSQQYSRLADDASQEEQGQSAGNVSTADSSQHREAAISTQEWDTSCRSEAQQSKAKRDISLRRSLVKNMAAPNKHKKHLSHQ